MGAWDVTQGVGDVLTPHSGEINPTFPTQCFQWECKGKWGRKGEVLSSPPVQTDGEAEQTFPALQSRHGLSFLIGAF